MPEDAPVAPDGSAPRPRPRRRFRSAHEIRTRRRRIALYTVFGCAFVLMINALVGENGYVATLRAEREYAEAVAALNARLQENQRLVEEIRRLQHDPAGLEDAARRQGLMEPGETVIVIHDLTPPPGSTSK